MVVIITITKERNHIRFTYLSALSNTGHPPVPLPTHPDFHVYNRAACADCQILPTLTFQQHHVKNMYQKMV